jgi:hypothetical protein
MGNEFGEVVDTDMMDEGKKPVTALCMTSSTTTETKKEDRREKEEIAIIIVELERERKKLLKDMK